MMLFYRVVLVFMHIAVVDSHIFYDCPFDWFEHDETCYKFNFYPKRTLIEAKHFCQNNGASVLTVETLTEHQFIVNWLYKFDSQRNAWLTNGIMAFETNGVAFSGYLDMYTQNKSINLSAVGTENHNKYSPVPDSNHYIAYAYADGKYVWFHEENIRRKMSYICEINKEEAYKIQQDFRDFTYGTNYTDNEHAPKGPRFYIEPESIEIIGRSKSVYVECAADSTPRPDYMWYYFNNNSWTPLTSNVNRYTITNGRVTIRDPTEALDGGYYQCEVQNQFGIVLTAPVHLSFAGLGDFSNVDTAPVQPEEHQGAVIQCPKIQSKSQLGIMYQWKIDGRFIITELMNYIFISGDGGLYFSEVTRSDTGNYHCIANLANPSKQYMGYSQTQSRTSLGIPLLVSGAPSVINRVQIQDSFIQVFPRQPLVGNNIRLECFAYGTGPLTYEWKLPSQTSERVSYSDNNRILSISAVSLRDSGIYTCTCYSKKTRTEDRKDFHLMVESKPIFTRPLQDQHADKDSQLSWRCDVTGIPSATFTWYKNGQILLNGTDYLIQENVLIIPVIKHQHSGMYQCMATNTHGASTSTAQLRVLFFGPTFKKHPMNAKTFGTLGGAVTLLCHPDAAPRPVYRWLYNGTVVDPQDSHVQLLANGNLLIQNLMHSNEGTYTCQTENVYGKAENSTYLSILASTSIERAPLSVDTLVNGTVFLPCQASHNAILDLTYTWHRNDKLINFKQHLDLYKEPEVQFTQVSDVAHGPLVVLQGGIYSGDLYIKNVQFRHEGTYTCTARTQIDSASASARLTVFGPPGEPTAVHIDKGYQTGDSYSVRLTWMDGATHGYPIMSYIIQAKSNYSWAWTMVIDIPASDIGGSSKFRSVVVGNLIPGAAICFRVLASNKLGQGTASVQSEEFITQGAPPYRAPENVGGGGGKVGNLFITWQPLSPKDQHGWGIGYIVEWRRPTLDIRTAAKWEKAVLHGIRNEFVTTIPGENNYYIEYEVQVTAFNDFGVGSPSRIARVFTADDIPVGVPTDVWAESFNSTALTIHWTPVPDTRQIMKGKLKGYRVNYWKRFGEDENQAVQASFPGQISQATIIGLLPDTWYFVSVLVYNQAGNGQKSDRYPQKTNKMAPQMYPTEVYVHSYGSDSVQVTFRGVSTTIQEEPLQGYKIRIWEMSDNIRRARDLDVGKAVSGIVTGIKKNCVYKLRILGYSRGGDGSLSSPPTLFTLGGYVYYDRTSTLVMPACAESVKNIFIITLLPFMVLFLI